MTPLYINCSIIYYIFFNDFFEGIYFNNIIEYNFFLTKV